MSRISSKRRFLRFHFLSHCERSVALPYVSNQHPFSLFHSSLPPVSTRTSYLLPVANTPTFPHSLCHQTPHYARLPQHPEFIFILHPPIWKRNLDDGSRPLTHRNNIQPNMALPLPRRRPHYAPLQRSRRQRLYPTVLLSRRV